MSGSDEYIFGLPQIQQAEISLKAGKKLKIRYVINQKKTSIYKLSIGMEKDILSDLFLITH